MTTWRDGYITLHSRYSGKDGNSEITAQGYIPIQIRYSPESFEIEPSFVEWTLEEEALIDWWRLTDSETRQFYDFRLDWPRAIMPGDTIRLNLQVKVTTVGAS